MYCHICLTVIITSKQRFFSKKTTGLQKKNLQHFMTQYPLRQVFLQAKNPPQLTCVVRTSWFFVQLRRAPWHFLDFFLFMCSLSTFETGETRTRSFFFGGDPSPAKPTRLPTQHPWDVLRDLFFDFKSICCEIVFHRCSVYIHIFMMYVHMSSL